MILLNYAVIGHVFFYFGEGAMWMILSVMA